MTLTLHYHPLSSYCHKVLVALYELGTDFRTHHLDFSNPEVQEALKQLWPMCKMPVLVDDARGTNTAESSVIIEYVDTHYPGAEKLIPQDTDHALEVRKWDRIFDLYIQNEMQRIVGDSFRPDDAKDPFGVEQAKGTMLTAYGMLDAHLMGKEWVTGDSFTMADCAAVPALFYGSIMVPTTDFPNVTAYFERLIARPSVARVLSEAKPWFHLFPYLDRMPDRFK
ncbi:glutathione S-transferase family protein [Kordiimonas gwangyangensis]|uniref:glutathione S-transferase family protein n=1 Tax=Kordiimonas gwangyangensis TaxID=288022 RepID=UPI00035E9439|nr:glutathione S-transferase family protein [Kordiimonas gwangyangensis]